MSPAEPAAGFTPVDLQLRDGRRVTLRTVRPEDKDEYQAAFNRLSEESRYARFMSAVRELSPQTLEHATHPDEAHELVLVAVASEGARERIVAGARYAAEPGGTNCEFAVTVTDPWQGRGLAGELLAALMGTARARGFKHMDGYILASNARMLRLAKRLGFVQVPSPEDPTVRLLRCDLARAP